MSATVETVTVKAVVVREKKPTLPAKYSKNLVFGFWLIEKLHDQGLLSESTPAFDLLQLFADVPTHISYMDEGFFEELSSLTKDMKAKIRAFHKPVKASTKKNATAEDAPAKKRGRKKALVIPPVLDEQSQIIADLVETANPTKKLSAIEAVRSLTAKPNTAVEQPNTLEEQPKNKKNYKKKNTPTDTNLTTEEVIDVTEIPIAVVSTPKNKKTSNKKTSAATTTTTTATEIETVVEQPKAATPKTKKTTNKKNTATTTTTTTTTTTAETGAVEVPKAVVSTPKNKKNSNKKNSAVTVTQTVTETIMGEVTKTAIPTPLEEGEVDDDAAAAAAADDTDDADDEIEASPFVFNQQHFLIDNNNILYHPSSFLVLGYFDPILQSISLN